MKVRLIAVAMLVAGVVTTSLADEPAKLKMAIVKRSEHVYKVIYSGDAAETILTLKNHFGELVYFTHINSARGFILPLNFTNMQPGRYTIEVVSGRERFSETISYGGTVDKNTIPFIAHVSRLGANRYLCSVKSDGHLPVTLNVQDANGETLAQHRIDQAETAFVISLKNFSGKPIFVLNDATGHSVTIKK